MSTVRPEAGVSRLLVSEGFCLAQVEKWLGLMASAGSHGRPQAT